LVKQSLKFSFRASNNQAKYEALLAGLFLAKDIEVRNLIVRSDSQLVIEQVAENFQAKDSHLVKYLPKVRLVVEAFEDFDLVYVPRDQNSTAHFRSKFMSTKKLKQSISNSGES